ncbi:MAG: cbb3-type cytochrome c oxidase subunit I [bacterium]|jgi:cytochrome o ubiquinol oxidase subunit I
MNYFAGILGLLTIDAFKHDLVQYFGVAVMTLSAIFAVLALTYFKRWKWLFGEWLTSLDPKRIGVMYIAVAVLMLLKAGTDAGMMRLQQSISVGNNQGFLKASHYQQVFSAHGTTMIFFAAMGLMFGLINIGVPLLIGSRDVAFPFLNSVSFWLFVSGMLLLNTSLAIGDFSGAGWLAYPPLSELQFSPSTGVDYWIWSLQIAGIGSLLSGINFIVTIIKNRAKGMTLMKMPMFVWSVFGSMTLVIFAFPILTVTITLLYLDRLLGMHFFTGAGGGNPMMYVNLIWAWGHPEVYILILPAFGIFSEIVATFSRKRLFGYTSMVWAIWAIVLLSFTVWLHHFFTMGSGADVNGFFGIMTMIIAIPTGVKIFNWLFTMFRGRIKFASPMIWFMGFIILFSIGGIAGVLLAVPPADFQLNNSLFLVAHFHSMIVSGVLFGYFAGLTYWFPKIYGFSVKDKIGKYAAYFWIVGFIVAFVPLYILGILGATRRMNHYSSSLGFQPLFIVAGIGVLIIGAGLFIQLIQIITSIRDRKKLQDKTGDPWNGRTLEWSIPSPAPEYSFAILPIIKERDQFWNEKQDENNSKIQKKFKNFSMPKNSYLGLVIAFFAFSLAFAAVWHILWLFIFGLLGIISIIIIRSLDENRDRLVTFDDLSKVDQLALGKEQ